MLSFWGFFKFLTCFLSKCLLLKQCIQDSPGTSLLCAEHTSTGARARTHAHTHTRTQSQSNSGGEMGYEINIDEVDASNGGNKKRLGGGGGGGGGGT